MVTTPNKNLDKPAYNSLNWNTPLNADFDIIDTALGGSTSINVTSASGSVTLTLAQYQPLQLVFTGVLTSNVRYLVPSGVGGQWTVTNSTTGSFTLKMASAAGGADITIPSGSTIVCCDGTSSGMRLSVSSTGAAPVTTFSAGTTGFTPSSATNGGVTLDGVLAVKNGGSGLSTLPSAGQILIGNGSSYTLNTITGGSGITVNNLPAGNITISATGSGGTVTSVGFSTSLSGLTVLGSPISGAGTIQLGGTLGVTSGGTGSTTTFSTGSIIFAGSSGVYSQNNSALYWDNTNKRIGVNTTTPSAAITAIEASSANAGYFGNTSTGSGVAGVSVTGIGVNGVASSTSAGAYGVGGQNSGSGGGTGAVGVSSGSGGYAFRSLAGGYSPFTGCHDGFINKAASPAPGDLLVDGVVVGKKLSDVITEVSASTAPNQAVIGVFVQTYPTDIANVPPSLMLPDGSPDPAWYVYAPTHNLAVIDGVGEGCLNVVGEGGNIQKGDLLVTSSTPGKAMKQADDIIRGYTVARAREDAVFAPGEEKQIACIYLCG